MRENFLIFFPLFYIDYRPLWPPKKGRKTEEFQKTRGEGETIFLDGHNKYPRSNLCVSSGDTAHKSHMQSIIDKLQTPQSFGLSVQASRSKDSFILSVQFTVIHTLCTVYSQSYSLYSVQSFGLYVLVSIDSFILSVQCTFIHTLCTVYNQSYTLYSVQSFGLSVRQV